MKKYALVLYVIVALLALQLEYYVYQPLTAKIGELKLVGWQSLPAFSEDSIKIFGNGNSVRPVLFSENIPCLELAAGNDGTVEYRVAVPVDSSEDVLWRLMFLSMQGNGRVEIRGFDATGKLLVTSGYTFSGAIANNAKRKMHSERSTYNFVGEWVDERKNIGDIMRLDFASDATKIKRLELVLTVENGQHVLVEKFISQRNNKKSLTIQARPIKVIKGERLTAQLAVRNISNRIVNDIKIRLIAPYGFGIIPVNKAKLLILDSGEEKTLQFDLAALRSSEVNFNKPWQVTIMADEQPVGYLSVDVVDDKPGKTFYVMTDDLEVIDAAGYPKPWGEKQAWITAEEVFVQMKDKAEKLNAIAEQYGARWTHYIALPIIRAAQEMALAGGVGWRETVEAVRQSVKTQAALGHEYGIHMHTDYDPLVKGNTLSLNYAQNGFWANHLRHGWAHSVKPAGDYYDYNSRAGILFSYISELQELTADSPSGTSITSRVGSFDYGVGAADQANSYIAYRAVGLFGSSDAPGNLGEFVSAEYGKEIYFSRPEAIEKSAIDLDNVGLVEFLPTPKKRIEYDSDSLAELNQKVDAGMSAFFYNNKTRAGIHAIVGFTHAMFVMGDADWTSTSGGAFQKISKHLEYVKAQYVVNNRLEFATASQLVKEYLDYYSPQPVAIIGALLQNNAGCAEYKVTVLGKDIEANADYQHLLKAKFPLWLNASAYAAAICKNGKVISYYAQLPNENNDLNFVYNDNTAVYSVRIWHDRNISRALRFFREIAESFMGIWQNDNKRGEKLFLDALAQKINYN
ncbi:MAG: hypothetical protein WCP79_03645 [Bacillota bacterium]